MRAERITFTNEKKNSFLVEWEDGTKSVGAWPPAGDDISLVEGYGGQYEIERSTVDYRRELEKKEELFHRFQMGYIKYIESFSIDAILAEDIDKADMMKIKMSMFKKDIVKNCKDRELLTGLRKADDIVDIMMYYGMIRAAASSV